MVESNGIPILTLDGKDTWIGVTNCLAVYHRNHCMAILVKHPRVIYDFTWANPPRYWYVDPRSQF